MCIHRRHHSLSRVCVRASSFSHKSSTTMIGYVQSSPFPCRRLCSCSRLYVVYVCGVCALLVFARFSQGFCKVFARLKQGRRALRKPCFNLAKTLRKPCRRARFKKESDFTSYIIFRFSRELRENCRLPSLPAVFFFCQLSTSFTVVFSLILDAMGNDSPHKKTWEK